MKIVFFLRHFNDVDHIAPIIWHCLEQGDDITAILLDNNYNVAKDPRLNFLSEYDNYHMEFVDSFLDLKWGRPLFSLGSPDGREPANPLFNYIRRGLQVSGIARNLVTPSLKELNPSACIFEWGGPSRTSHREFFEAATALDIPRLCFPHGLSIYLNEDIKPGRKDAYEQRKPKMAPRNRYDAYVTQSEYDRELDGKLGLDPNIHYALGSARYCPKWQSINKEFYHDYESMPTAPDSVNIVFMLPHWEYNVEKETTLQLISELADRDWVQLVVKEHTRGDSLPRELDDQLVRQDTTDVVADVASVSLIKWADAVINFGSSIGIEALQQNKHLINPSYLHTNTTIFEDTGACHETLSNDETISTIERLHRDELEPISEANKDELYRAVVYGGQPEHNVLAAYRDLISQFASGE